MNKGWDEIISLREVAGRVGAVDTLLIAAYVYVEKIHGFFGYRMNPAPYKGAGVLICPASCLGGELGELS
ncbi:MAG: hypothetical protein D3903_19085 [Candidatus Electrothrix sp. GM3_4]|nr:hypothetical protein [Candidatus Electrothrix sp. GM3_4]